MLSAYPSMFVVPAAAAIMVVLTGTLVPMAQGRPRPEPALIHVSDPQRQTYLARATVWADRSLPGPESILRGQTESDPLAHLPRNAASELPCTYLQGGAASTGRTEKFTCRTSDGRTLRVKYFDGNPKTGNREVFSEVVATRLYWALGFGADALFPVNVLCQECPEDPNTGKGARATRRYAAVVEALYDGIIVSSGVDPNQGWGFKEVDRAIAALPPGPTRDSQRAAFDALVLLSVFVQHGDRKPSQQRLVCRAPLDLSAGDLHADDQDGSFHLPVLFERDGATACSDTAITVQDLGATFGGAGKMTPRSSKINLPAWAAVPVFARTGPGACRGALAMAASAGRDAGGDLVVSEAGRRLLFERMSALTPAHVRALFESARLDALGETPSWRDPATGVTHSGLDAWVAVFMRKVAEIGAATC